MEGLDLFIQEGTFVQFPVEWVTEMKGEDVKRMILLQWRFDFFASMAASEGRDIRRCFFESQEKLAILFGMSSNSRTKVGQFLKRMEVLGFISTEKENIQVEGGFKSRIYIVVNNPILLQKYSRAS